MPNATRCAGGRRGGRASRNGAGATLAAPALLAQLVEHLHGKEGVDGSSPSEGSAKGPEIGLLLADRLAGRRTLPFVVEAITVDRLTPPACPVLASLDRTRLGQSPGHQTRNVWSSRPSGLDPIVSPTAVTPASTVADASLAAGVPRGSKVADRLTLWGERRHPCAGGGPARARITAQGDSPHRESPCAAFVAVDKPAPTPSGPYGGDCFESGVDAEGTKETSDVVPHRLGAQMELGRDLLRRAALLQETQHLDLAGGEMRRWR